MTATDRDGKRLKDKTDKPTQKDTNRQTDKRRVKKRAEWREKEGNHLNIKRRHNAPKNPVQNYALILY